MLCPSFLHEIISGLICAAFPLGILLCRSGVLQSRQDFALGHRKIHMRKERLFLLQLVAEKVG